jgi:hypothetical protein
VHHVRAHLTPGAIMTTSGRLLAANGIDATTGDYLLRPMDPRDVVRAATTTPQDRASASALAARHRRRTEAVYAPKHGVDPSNLAQTGWGVVFAATADPKVKAALSPLLEHRRRQAAAVAEHRFRELTGADGYRNGESKQDFLRRHGSGPGPVDPDVVPYYLLLVGGPGEIPFEVQYQLDVQHAVGRIAFDDVGAYARYAHNVVAAETTAAKPGPARLAFFAARNDGDPATALSAEYLVDPLAAELAADGSWQVDSVVGSNARKEALSGLLQPGRDVLFTATHGIAFPAGHSDQYGVQGGLVCQDWPGPGHGPVAPQHWFGASDVPDRDLTGLVAFLFACFGAGTPQYDDFDRSAEGPRRLAPRPFVAALPQALLGRAGGALAVVGHIDRAWGYSFVWPGVGGQTEVYRSTLAELGAGRPIGSALEYVGDRYAELATDLGLALEEIRLGRRADPEMIAGLWTACTDARGFVLLGDPAVRLTRTNREAHAAHHQQEGVEESPGVDGISTARSRLLTSVELDFTADTHASTTHTPGSGHDRGGST